MNKKRFALTVVVIFVTVLLSDFVLHQVFLKNMYAATMNLWRPEAEMQGLFHYMLIGQLVEAVFLTWIFIHGYKGTGILEGVRFGLLVGGLEMGKNFIMYVVAPYPRSLTTAWIAGGFVQGVLVGVVASFVYGRK